jgi:CubicO group peptidase (beta-lactamase class C family)
MASWHCPGLAMAVVHQGEVVFQAALGLRDLQRQLPVTPDTRFAFGSVTKSVTAASVALAVDDKLLEWDKPVCEFLPGFLLDDPYATRHVTLRDMLSHRTGLPRHDYAAWRLDVPRAAFIHRLRHLKLSASLRAVFQYNNVMYMAAAHAVEHAAGEPWEDYVQRRLFTPLGMRASNFVPEHDDTALPRALGYRVERDEQAAFEAHLQLPLGPHTDLSPGPAGALFSTLADMTAWVQLHIDTGRHGDTQLVTRANMLQLQTPQMVMPVNDTSRALSGLAMHAYGMGWMIRPYPYGAGTLVYHDGNVEGFSAHVSFVPEARLGIVAVCNDAMSSLPTAVAREAADRVLGLPARDWNARFHATVDPLQVAFAQGKKSAAEDRRADAPPSHPLADYEGTYAADGYPDFAVRLQQDALQGSTVGSMPWAALRHVHHDLFEWDVPAWGSRFKARFALDDNGEVASVAMPLAMGVPDIEFRRKPPEVDAATLRAIAGDYDPRIPGLVFKVVEQQGALRWYEGAESYALVPRKLGADTAVFAIERTRIVFSRSGGRWDHVVVKNQLSTFHAERIA